LTRRNRQRRPSQILLPVFLLLMLTFCATSLFAAEPFQRVPILCYHRFGPTAADMTVTTPVLIQQLDFLRDHGYTVVPLQAVVDYQLGKGAPPPPKSVVITVDDGHRSVYDVLYPLVKQYHIPVTLFIYPSAISNASYAMAWDQLRELRDTGLFNIQSHTYWHPNFKQERKRLTPAAYQKFVATQLQRSKAVLEKRLGGNIDLLAWPFGIYDDTLMEQAAQAGYVAAFSIDGRQTDSGDKPLSLPRFLMTNGHQGRLFENLVAPAPAHGAATHTTAAK